MYFYFHAFILVIISTSTRYEQECGDFSVQVSSISAAPHLNTTTSCLPYLKCALQYSELKHDGGKLPSVVPLEGNKLAMEYAGLAREDWKEVDENHPDSG